MLCPACDHALKSITVNDDVTVDVCEGGCGGIWFDRYELQHFDESHEEAGLALLDIETNPGTKIDHDKRFSCPKCDDQIMMRHFFSVKHEVEVDECPACAGFWLDAGELRQIRSLYKTLEEANEAARACLHDVFGEEFDTLRQQGEKQERIANFFRFLSPSHYLKR